MNKKSSPTFAGVGGAIILAVVLAGCHTVPVGESISLPSVRSEVPLNVGLYLSNEFRNYQHVQYSTGDQWFFPIGRVSADQINASFEIVFDDVALLRSEPSTGQASDEMAFAITPHLDNFRVVIPSGAESETIYRANIAYRFDFAWPDGEPFFSWRVAGKGQLSKTFGEMAVNAEAQAAEVTDNSIESAMNELVTEVPNLPEVQWWLKTRGKPRSTRLSAAAIDLGNDAEAGPNARALNFDGQVSVLVDPYVESARQLTAFGRDLTGTSIVPARLAVTNTGNGTLYFRRSSIRVDTVAGVAREISTDLLARYLTERQARAPMIHLGPGPLALQGLFGALANAQAESVETLEYGEWLDRVHEPDFDMVELASGEAADGFIFFDRSEIIGTPSAATLEIPVINLDAMQRYVLEFEL